MLSPVMCTDELSEQIKFVNITAPNYLQDLKIYLVTSYVYGLRTVRTDKIRIHNGLKLMGKSVHS